MVKITYHSPIGPELHFQNSHLSVTPVPEDFAPFSDFHRHQVHAVHIHAGKTIMHITLKKDQNNKNRASETVR